MELDALPSLVEKFMSTVSVDNGCWLWTGSIDKSGYGLFHADKLYRAHRWAYILFVGEIAPLDNGRPRPLDHFACDTRSCVNPSHVRPVTHRENLLRGRTVNAANAAKRECLRGHPFDESNTYVSVAGKRTCRKCTALRMRIRRSNIGRI